MPSRPVMERLSFLATGFICGASLWMLFGRPAASSEGLEVFAHPPARETQRSAVGLLLARLEPVQSFGVFPKRDMPEGQGVAPDVGALKLLGTSASPTRKAALVSVSGAIAQWIAMGEPVSGLELVELGASRAVVRSASGQTTTLSLFPAVSPTNAESTANENRAP